MMLATGAQALAQTPNSGMGQYGANTSGFITDEYDSTNQTTDPQQQMDLDQQSIDDQQKMLEQQLANIAEALQLDAMRMENKWKESELREFRRMLYLLARDEHEARQRKTELESQRHELTKFLNGRCTPQSHAKFVKSIQQLEQTSELRHLLVKRVPAIRASDFERKSELFKALNRDGSLMPAPIVRDDTGTFATDASTFETYWVEAVETIVAGGTVTPEQLEQLHGAWEESKQAAEDLAASTSLVDQSRVRAYYRSLKLLIDTVQNPRQTAQLRDFLDSGAFAFHGGTVADLIQHVAEKRLSVRYGSRAQLFLSELGDDLLSNLDDQIASLVDRIEQYKAQSPLRDGTIKRSDSSIAEVSDSESNPSQVASKYGASNPRIGSARGVDSGPVVDSVDPQIEKLRRPITYGIPRTGTTSDGEPQIGQLGKPATDAGKTRQRSVDPKRPGQVSTQGRMTASSKELGS